MEKKFRPQKCGACDQTLTYALAIDRGTVDLVKAIAIAIGRKGINAVHPRKEMEVAGRVSYAEMVREGKLTSNQVGNLSRPRFHGLIAAIHGEPGNYCLTRKGAAFLRGEPVPRVAIISKISGHQIGYHEPQADVVTVRTFSPADYPWEGINYDIVEGRIIPVQPAPVQEALL